MTAPAPETRASSQPASSTSAQEERLPEAASLLLDVIRFTLAVLVVVGHASMPWFSTGWPPLLGWADVAVPGFFVLSGFMIRYVTEDRERDPRRYFISRASRMYSVLLPALLLTLVCRSYISWRNPVYATVLWRAQSLPALGANLVAHLLFFTQFWGHAVLVSPNLPLWSLGYEVPYYVLFGLFALCRGPWRWIAAALYVAALGPQVLFLAPLWWSGCWLYNLWQWSRQSRARSAMTAALALVCSLALLLPLAHPALWTRLALLPNPLTALGQPHGRATMLAYSSGLVSWMLMLLGLCLSDRIRLSKRAPWARPVRRIAEGTFTLYLFHYPLLCLVPPTLGHVLRSGWSTTLLVLSIVALCVALSQPIDALKNRMRRSLTARFA
ncbi:acyltransferase family protein [Terriglobus aquaticus]|uniref:Acyltransferase family protein n=1 Tax=Terriglobus aquaticus TaxID=940139 RepID=A0ABW9KLL5_9BACT|nr:acyltransferase [Terriglobus aquaticus]